MDDLIERSALLKDLKSDCPESNVCIADTSCIECIINRQPTIEAEPVRHGRWVDTGVNKYICTVCEGYVYKYFGKSDFCPRCGAKMDRG